jgi:hypothetical protein
MPKFVFNGGYPRYYPTIPVFAKHGEVHELAEAPDADWSLAGPEMTAAAPVAAVPDTDTKTAENIAQKAAPALEVDADDALRAAEALLEANPALAARLVEEAKHNA